MNKPEAIDIPANANINAEGRQPDTRDRNFFDDDPALQVLLKHYLPADQAAHLWSRFRHLGTLAANEIDRLAFEADKNPPELVTRDRRGEDIQEVRRHPSYRELERLAYQEFEMSTLSHRPALGWKETLHPAAKYAITYLFTQGEFGLMCPVSMSDALTRTLLRHADEGMLAPHMEALLAQDLDGIAQGAMFMTEQQAGSDVGAVATIAVPADPAEVGENAFYLYGDKWFCSNPDAAYALVLARPEGSDMGTRGLGLFLLPRRRPDGSLNAYRILRLKEKLGTRSMASGEIKMEGALAWQVGAPGQGFRQMTEMINQSRLSNGVRAAGLMRRACHEALAVARGRSAFNQRLIDMPLMQRQLMKMLVPTEQALSFCFLTAEALQAADAGDEQGKALRRILTPLIKFRACRDARKVCGDGLEVRGGCGYIEEWVESRLVRDSHLGSVWEGTSNIVALDVLRAARRDGCHRALHTAMQAKLETPEMPSALKDRLSPLLEKSVAMVDNAISGNQEPALARQAASGLYHATSAVQMAWEGALLGDEQNGVADRLLWSALTAAHRLEPHDPLEAMTGDESALADALLSGKPLSATRARNLLDAL